ncbi:Transcriptional regulator [Nitrospira japonica]|uniref:Transcriptional regulator n=1 Tax=Nitrospira japonica TaxID=1325564 RepID=A0A1W1IA70_9BACT|nr:TetR/AcrR family transcriptional regulator [Nitrospira japonica]SLM49890.1 Transcriptional regulator [Nitrospira japonica]
MPTRKPVSRQLPNAPATQRVVAAARRHFLSQGFRRVTMDELADELGMSKKTLYGLFPSKTALVESVILDKFRCAEADLRRITAASRGDVPGALRRLVAAVQTHTQEIQAPFVRDIQRDAPHLFEVVEQKRRELIRRHFGKLLSEGRRARVIRRDIPMPLIMEILLGTVRAVMNPPKLIELGLTPDQGYSAIMSVIFEGLLAGTSRRLS